MSLSATNAGMGSRGSPMVRSMGVACPAGVAPSSLRSCVKGESTAPLASAAGPEWVVIGKPWHRSVHARGGARSEIAATRVQRPGKAAQSFKRVREPMAHPNSAAWAGSALGRDRDLASEAKGTGAAGNLNGEKAEKNSKKDSIHTHLRSAN